MIRHALALAICATLVSCSDPDREAPSGDSAAGACAAGESRWATRSERYERVGSFGAREGEEIQALGGIAAADGRVYVLDAGAGRVRVLDGEMRPVAEMGRPGRGPGELVRSTMPTSHGGSQRWIAASGDTVLVFDGERVVFFGADGVPGATWSPDRVRGSSPMQSRVSLAGGEVLFAAGGYDFSRGPGSPELTIQATTGDEPRDVAAIRLAELPGRPPVLSTLQARPRWDVRGRCLVLSDGASPWLLRVDVASGAADTLPLPLPDRVPPPPSPDEQTAAAAAGARRALPPPSAPLRVRDLVIDPDGTVWILPIQLDPPLSGAVEVIRLSSATGAAALDTLPAFPRAFGESGIFYSVEATEDGTAAVVRYRLAGR